MTDARGETLYQWGGHVPVDGEQPLAEIPLSPPLGAWHLRLYLNLESGRAIPVTSEYVSLFSGVLALIISIILLAVYFYRENRKVVRDALQKVSFVNQVSHELKTPLTNIRLYAELLDSRLEGEKEVENLKVIMTESRRLSRMINNVLTFSRGEGNGFEANSESVVIDEVILRVVDSFAPSLANRSIDVVVNCDAPKEIYTDADFVEQILSNIIGNVEKYASGGKYLEISSTQDEKTASVTVKDRGPGIPARERKNIFKPFYRIGDKLSEGAAGTGIGLAISRKLAEMLGGELVLESADSGSVFRLDIAVEGVPE